MKKVCWQFLAWAVLQGVVFAQSKAVPIIEPLPPAEEVVQKVVARSKWSRAQNFQQFYSFTKSTVTEEFDDEGKLKSKHEKSCRVPARNEAPPDVPNHSAADALNRESSDTAKDASQPPADETKQQPAKKRWIDIDEETIARFTFKPLRRELCNGRDTLVFAFESKRDLPIKRLQDRLVNKATGTVWVDAQEYEVVKADLRLKEPVSLVGGLIGAVQTFHYVFERTRVDEGVWLLAQTEMFIKARQLATLVRTKKQQHWSDFRKATRVG